MNLEINKELVVSTSHIREETAKLLEDEPRLTIYEYPFGWRILAGEAEWLHATGHGELANLIKVAKQHDCAWLVLDQDGPTIDNFKTFDW